MVAKGPLNSAGGYRTKSHDSLSIGTKDPFYWSFLFFLPHPGTGNDGIHSGRQKEWIIWTVLPDCIVFAS
jgi:hypothetical protein